MTETELDRRIAEVAELIRNLDGDLNRAPEWKRSHRWYADRLTERNRLVLKLADLHAQQFDAAMCN